METKAERFKRLAERRTARVLEGIRRLARLANGHLYDFTDDQVNQIFGSIQRRLDTAKSRFEAELEFGPEARDEFHL